ncbi:hypothetical protein AHAS_Ahas20G0178800 [Arachis hypogaea]
MFSNKATDLLRSSGPTSLRRTRPNRQESPKRAQFKEYDPNPKVPPTLWWPRISSVANPTSRTQQLRPPPASRTRHLRPVPKISSEIDLQFQVTLGTRFYPPQRINRLRAEVQTFRQQDGETLYEAWERFKDLTRRCPPDIFNEWVQLHIFYEGLSYESKKAVDHSSEGSLNKKKTIEEAIDVIETVAENDYFYASERGNTRGVMELNNVDALLAQNKMITKQLADLTKKMERNQVAAISTSAATQEGVNEEAEGDQEQANYIRNSPRQHHDPYSKTYNPGWRNYPNFGWENQQDQGQDQRRHNPSNNATHQHSTQRSYQHPPNNTPQHPYQSQNGPSHPSNLNSPSSEERLSRIEALLEGICKEIQDNKVFKEEVRANIKNKGDAIKKLEFQVGYLSEKIPKPTDIFPSDTEKNLRGEAKKVR